MSDEPGLLPAPHCEVPEGVPVRLGAYVRVEAGWSGTPRPDRVFVAGRAVTPSPETSAAVARCYDEGYDLREQIVRGSGRVGTYEDSLGM